MSFYDAISPKQRTYLISLVGKQPGATETFFKGTYPMASETEVVVWLRDHMGIDLDSLDDLTRETASHIIERIKNDDFTH